jgi:hypothetical protein
MRASALKYKVLSWVSGLTMLIFLLVPFHAFITVWAASAIGHYTALRLWKEAILVVAAIGLFYLVMADHKIRSHTLTRRLVWLILAYALVNAVWGLIALHNDAISPKALGYGLIVNLRFLAFFLLCWSLGLRMSRMRSHWQWLLLWPAAIVVVFGLLQIFILPHDFLIHFGYGIQTISPYETINHDSHYIRIASTLRGANPLGAYLLIPLSMLALLLLKGKQNRKQLALFIGTLIVLFFSFSRSAWIGAILALSTILVLQFPKIFVRRSFLLASAGLITVAAIAIVALNNNSRFQNIVFHTQDNSAVKTTSNGGHLSALKDGAKDLVHEPLGEGPGSAGPASVYNNHPPRIAENYYMQIAQETGWIGLILFLLINFGVGYLLWLRRDDTLALGLLASLIGISFINLLSHAWADDTTAYIWWGMAGIAMINAKKSKSE